MEAEDNKAINATEEPTAPQGDGRPPSGLAKVLYRQLDILQAEQDKICHTPADLEVSTKNTRAEKQAFSEQIRKTAETIMTIKRRNKA